MDIREELDDEDERSGKANEETFGSCKTTSLENAKETLISKINVDSSKYEESVPAS